MLKIHQWLPSTLCMKAKLLGAEQNVFLCPPPQLVSARSLVPPSAACAPPAFRRDSRSARASAPAVSRGQPACLHPQLQLCALSPSPTLLLTPPHHFSFCSRLPTRAQHASSGPESRANTHGPPHNSVLLLILDALSFVPQRVSVRTRAQHVIPAGPCPALGGVAVTTQGKHPSSPWPLLLRRKQLLTCIES